MDNLLRENSIARNGAELYLRAGGGKAHQVQRAEGEFSQRGAMHQLRRAEGESSHRGGANSFMSPMNVRLGHQLHRQELEHGDLQAHLPRVQENITLTEESHPQSDPFTTSFRWTIPDLCAINLAEHQSKSFEVGGCKWCISCGTDLDHLGIYVAVADLGSLSCVWSALVDLKVTIVNQLNKNMSVQAESKAHFTLKASRWGVDNILSVGDLYDPVRGFWVKDSLIVNITMKMHMMVDYWAYDSKKETGFVGLKSQKETCCMSSLLQALYHIPYFRKVIYHIPMTENDLQSVSIPLALQCLFSNLHQYHSSVDTTDLTNCFHWNCESSVEADDQKLNRFLFKVLQALHKKTKGTCFENTMSQLFEGHQMSYTQFSASGEKVKEKQSFFDVHLDMRGCSSIYQSLDRYIKVQNLGEGNSCNTRRCGPQEARRVSLLFMDFPSILLFRLKRPEHDLLHNTVANRNNRYTIPLQLDMDKWNGKYLSLDASRSIRNIYTLQSVLVHYKDGEGEHSYALIRPELSDQWYKFDDEFVSKENLYCTQAVQRGKEEEMLISSDANNKREEYFTNCSNVHMLVYIRHCDQNKILQR